MKSFQKAMILEQDEILPVIHEEVITSLTKALGQKFAFGCVIITLPTDKKNPVLNINIEMHPTRLFKEKYRDVKYTHNGQRSATLNHPHFYFHNLQFS